MTNTAEIATTVEIEAVIKNRQGEIERVYAGSQPAWAWDADGMPAWRKMMRKNVLEDRTSDPRGWRVTFEEIERY